MRAVYKMIANLIGITDYYSPASYYSPARHCLSPRHCGIDPQSINARYLTLNSFLPAKRRATGCRVKHDMTMRNIYFNFIKYLREQIAVMVSSLRGVSAIDQWRQRTFFRSAGESSERADISNNKQQEQQ